MATDAVIFDVYGTLLLPTRATTRVRPPPFRALLEGLGALTDEQVETARHLSIVRPLPRMADAAALLERELGRPVPPALVEQQEAALATQLATFELRAGALEALDALRGRGTRVALLSNLASPYKEPVRRLGLEARVDVAVYSCDVGLAKPDPAIFALTLERLGVTAASAVMIGDREDLDTRGALDAGLRALKADRRRSLSDLLSELP